MNEVGDNSIPSLNDAETQALLLALDIGSDLLIDGDAGAAHNALGLDMLKIYEHIMQRFNGHVPIAYNYRHLYRRHSRT